MSPDLAPSVAMPAFFAAETPPQWLDFVARKPRGIAEIAESVALRQAHVDRLRELTIIGRRAYGRDRKGNDHWDDEPPFVDGQQAVGFDCENLALWARRIMAEEFDDWPLGCARPTLCIVPRNQAHCVLTVVAEGFGDYVIGALPGEYFVPWRSLQGYQWRSRLEAGNEWRMVAG